MQSKDARNLNIKKVVPGLAVVIAAVVLCIGAINLRAQRYGEDDFVEPVVISQENAGAVDIQPAEYWFASKSGDEVAGYSMMKIGYEDNKLVFKIEEKVRYGFIHLRWESENTTTYNPNNLIPIKQVIKFRRKSWDTKTTIYKEIYYDWAKRQITIIPGQGLVSKRRVLAIPRDAISDLMVFNFTFTKKNLIPGTTYSFNVFDPDNERFIKVSRKVVRAMPDDVFELYMDYPTAFGDYVTSSAWINPRSPRYPHGRVKKEQYYFPWGGSAVQVYKTPTTKKKALKSYKVDKKDWACLPEPLNRLPLAGIYALYRRLSDA